MCLFLSLSLYNHVLIHTHVSHTYCSSIAHTSHMHRTYIVQTSHIHRTDIAHASAIHRTCIVHTSHMHRPYIAHAPHMHSTCIAHTSHMLHRTYIAPSSSTTLPRQVSSFTAMILAERSVQFDPSVQATLATSHNYIGHKYVGHNIAM